jgi:hypothetical protein
VNQRRLINLFVWSSAALLTTTAIAKLVSCFGTAKILQNSDPLVGLRFGHLMFIAGILELGVAAHSLFSRNRIVTVTLIAWLASIFVLYRIGLFFVGLNIPCPCLGGFTDAIHLRREIADIIMKIVLGYLLLGSYGVLLWRQKQQRMLIQQTARA